MSTHIPYTYVITFKPTGQRYYGVRYAKNCHPCDLWKQYFTSSKHIDTLIKKYGKSSFIYEVRKIFPNDSKRARLWENTVLKRLHVVGNDKWLNKTDNFSCEPMRGDASPSKRPEVRKKQSDAHKGKVLSEEHKKHIGDFWRGKPKSKEHNEKNRQAQLAIGKKHSESQKAKWSKMRRGQNTGGNHPCAIPVVIDGVEFHTIRDAIKHFNTTRYTINKWIKRAGSTTCLSLPI